MANILIKFKDGTTRAFPHEGRSGGSYTKHLECTPGWVTVVDEYEGRTSFPSEDVLEALATQHQARF